MRNYNTSSRNNQPPNLGNSQKIDWEELSRKIIEDVAHRLMSHRPHQMIGGSLRFGNNGSFTVDPAKGVFYDHEEEGGGGVFQMVIHLLNCDKRQAYQWLSDNGYLDGTFNPAPTNTTPHNRRPRNRRSNTAGDKDWFQEGLKLWQEAKPIPFYQHHPVRRWCLHRNLSPGYSELPLTIRWHEGKGYIIVALASIQDFIDAHPDPPEPRQFHLIAIDKHGRKLPAFSGDDKRTWGQPGVTCVSLFGDPNADEINLCEGIADALAILSREKGAVIASITTLRKIKNDNELVKHLSDGNRTVTIFSDNDDAGSKAQAELAKTIHEHGGDVFVHENPIAKDPAAVGEVHHA